MKRRSVQALLASVLMLVALPVFASQASAAYDVSSPPTFTFVLDESTPQVDDFPGQKDLNAQAVATVAGPPIQLWTAVKWDDLDFSGGNTGDSCALFDTDLDNKANYVVCLVIAGKPAGQVTTGTPPDSPKTYSCSDKSGTKCTSKSAVISNGETACDVKSAAETFPTQHGTGDTDTLGYCRIDTSVMTGPNPPNLINTCSYPSSSPTSDPSDCVLIPRDAFIRIVKAATPSNLGSFPFRLGLTGATGADFPVVFTAAGSSTSTFIPIRSDGTNTYQVKEDVPANWAIAGTPSCTGATGTGSSNGTFAGDTISGINASPDNQITCTFNDVQQTGAIRILKQRAGASPAVPLTGAHFAISSGGNVVAGAGDLITTGAAGSICKDGLPLGSYSVNETQAPNGHRIDTTNPRTVSVTSAGSCTSGATDVTFDNALVLGTINITKTSGGSALAGAVFTLYTNNAPFTSPRGPDTAAGDPVTTHTCTSTATLTATGNCTIANIPLGRYWLVETPPGGYIGAVDSEVIIDVGTSPGAGTVLNIPISNQAAAGSVTISKTGFGGAALAGAVFRLYHRTSPTFLGSLPTSHDPCTTTAAGTCTIANVAPGDYWVVETSAPPGYTVAAPVAATVPLGSGAGVGASITVGPISDPVVPGTVTIHKTGIDDSLEGATFTLYVNNEPLTGPRGNSDDDPITTHTCTTNAAGDCSMTAVPLGHYWVVETVTPNGYDTAPEQTVNVGVGTVSEGVGDVDALTFADAAVPGTVVITKRDDAQNLLDGAVFKLYTNNAPTAGPRGDSVADPATTKTCTTGATSAGKCTITGVALGNYWIVEESAPNSHYVLAADRAITVGLGTVAAHVGDLVEPADFIDERKHRVVVLVCHEGTDTLFQRNVTLGGGAPKLSLGAGSLNAAQQKALCDTGGASFGDIAGHGDVSPVVHLDAPAAP